MDRSSGRHLFLCAWLITTDSIMLFKSVFNGGYDLKPILKLKKTVNFVEIGPVSLIDYYMPRLKMIRCASG